MVGPSVITIGNFDGVHLGHRAILDRARVLADQCGAQVKAVTFEPHPAAILRPSNQPLRICDARQKQQHLRDAGADQTVVLESNAQLLALAPQAFIERLVATHHPRAIVEGRNFRFGKSRSGDVAQLAKLGERLSYETVVVEPVEAVLTDQLVVPVSSSLVRWLVRHGRVADAGRCLGRTFALTARVTSGERRGRALGVPTANLDPADLDGKLAPTDGVYGGIVELPDGAIWPAAISVGVKPTFHDRARCVEAHLLDFDGDLYGQPLTVRWTRWLRDQRAFASIDDLRQQLDRDVMNVRNFFQRGLLEMRPHPPRPAATG